MKFRILSLFLAFCLLISGCGAAQAETTPSDTAVIFTDDLGRSVCVDSPQRVAALLGSFADIWMLSGGQVIATADDAWDDFGLELPESAINLGNAKELSLELLLSAQPDFILASTNTRQNIEWQETLESIGIPVAYFDVSDFDDYLRLLEICTRITGRPALYEAKGLAVQAEIDDVLEAAEARLAESDAPTVLCMRASASSVTVKNSADNVLGEMLRSLGCINIADSDASLLENLSLERILERDPDFIFIVQRGDDDAGTRNYIRQMLENSPAWSQLSAVKNDRVYIMDKRLYNLKPNDRWGEAYAGLEDILANG